MQQAATDSEFFYQAAFAPGAMQEFLSDPDNMSKVLHFTPHDEVGVYDAVDHTKVAGLDQTGRIVAITGAGRGGM
jgi:hypothetical protein